MRACAASGPRPSSTCGRCSGRPRAGQGPISVDPESTQFLLCVYHSPMRAGTPLTLGPVPHHPPADAGERADRWPRPPASIPTPRAACAEILERGFNNGVVLDCGGQRGRDLQLQHLPRQGRRRGDAGAQRQLPGRHHPQPHRHPAAQCGRAGRRAHRDDRRTSTTPTRSSPPAMPARCSRSAATKAATCSPARSPARRTSSTWPGRGRSG